MRILQLDEDTRGEIRKAIKHAEEHKMGIDMLRLLAAGKLGPAGDTPEFVTHIHDGYRVVFSIEEQPDPIGWCNHLSVSVEGGRDGKLPHPEAVKVILSEFGMNDDLENSLQIWIEKEISINILQKKGIPNDENCSEVETKKG